MTKEEIELIVYDTKTIRIKPLKLKFNTSRMEEVGEFLSSPETETINIWLFLPDKNKINWQKERNNKKYCFFIDGKNINSIQITEVNH